MKHPTLRFYLGGAPNRYGERQIFIDISIGNFKTDFTKQIKKFNSDNRQYVPIKLSVGYRIKPENFGRYIEKGSRKVFEFDPKIFDKYSKSNRTIKNRIDTIKKAINDVENQFEGQGEDPTNTEFKEALLIKLGRKKSEAIKVTSVLEFLYEKIKNDREDLAKKKKGALTENHIKTYVSLSRMFENYQIATKTIVLFSDFNDKDFYWGFFDVVDKIYKDEIKVKNPKQEKRQRKDPNGYGVKSINKYIKLLHRVLSLGKQAGENVTLDLSDPTLSLENPPAKKEIYLNEQEIQTAIEHTIGKADMENAREYMIMASLMGLRIEDMERLHKLTPTLFKGKKSSFYGVQTTLGKTKSEVIIPLLKPIRAILAGNNNQFPVFKESAVNVSLKKLAAHLKINSLETRTKVSFSKGKIVTQGIEKHKLISTHDCRRSFITNLLNDGVNGERIKYITHPKKTDNKDMIALYNKASLIDKAEAFLEELKLIKSEIYIY